MIEAGAKEVPEDTMFDAIMFAFNESQKVIKFINDIAKEVGQAQVLLPLRRG